MKRCRITVLKRHFDEELAKEYGSKGIGKCPMLKEGQIFYADYAKPDGFCDEASNGPTKKRPSTTPRITIRAEEIGEGEEKLSPESFSSPSPNPTLSSSKTFVFIESLFTAFPAQIAIRRIIFSKRNSVNNALSKQIGEQVHHGLP